MVHLLDPSGPAVDAGSTGLGSTGLGSVIGEYGVSHEVTVVEPARVGFVVSRAVGGSVVRNRVERRLRHLVRDHLASLPAGGRVVVRANPAAADAPSDVLARDLASALRRLLPPPEASS
ncbi:ribonuclease P protein component [Quadrisphaera granulorum]|uniref:Ribonuclease P protein component n=1 Tax=Quadrisphaera granulorum TaxID=317664 RepID=A0A316ADS4_9ACTN|nr:ribonuclease P protein component [Quadrisphaera granulorum]SZE95259.1 ribonuclease P protein component [Quadrisphaera granulorum]